jgi:hypothetical protein
MPKREIARYHVYLASAGCLPDSTYGLVYAPRRKDLAEAIRDVIAFYDLPARRFREVRIRRLWRYIRQWGSSCAHFSIECRESEHDLYSVHFSGLTEEEYNEIEAAEEGY